MICPFNFKYSNTFIYQCKQWAKYICKVSAQLCLSWQRVLINLLGVCYAEMSLDFFVPVCVGDLVKTGGINQYVVQDVVPAKQLPSHLNSKWYSLLNVSSWFFTYARDSMFSIIKGYGDHGKLCFTDNILNNFTIQRPLLTLSPI